VLPWTVLDDRLFNLLEGCGVKGSRNLLFRLTLPTDQDSPLLEAAKKLNVCWQQVLNKALQRCNNMWHARFEVLTVMALKLQFSWNVTPQRWVNISRRFKRSYCPHCQCLGCEDILILRNISKWFFGTSGLTLPSKQRHISRECKLQLAGCSTLNYCAAEERNIHTCYRLGHFFRQNKIT